MSHERIIEDIIQNAIANRNGGDQTVAPLEWEAVIPTMREAFVMAALLREPLAHFREPVLTREPISRVWANYWLQDWIPKVDAVMRRIPKGPRP